MLKKTDRWSSSRFLLQSQCRSNTMTKTKPPKASRSWSKMQSSLFSCTNLHSWVSTPILRWESSQTTKLNAKCSTEECYLCTSNCRLQEQQRKATQLQMDGKYQEHISRASLNTLWNNPNMPMLKHTNLGSPKLSWLLPHSQCRSATAAYFQSYYQRHHQHTTTTTVSKDHNHFKVSVINSDDKVATPTFICRGIDDADTSCKGASFVAVQLWHSLEGKANMEHTCLELLVLLMATTKACLVWFRTAVEPTIWLFMTKVTLILLQNSVQVSIGPSPYRPTISTCWLKWRTCGTKLAKNRALAIVSTGDNGSESHHYPETIDDVLSVAEITLDGTKDQLAEYNNKFDFAAPDVGIHCACR